MKIGELTGKGIDFLKEVLLEVKKINWPTRKETVRYTIIVVAVSLAVAILLGGFDFLFSLALQKLILK